MRRYRIAVVVAAVALVGAMAMPAHATGNEGCTPGFWKNHPGAWPSQPDGGGYADFFSVFDVPELPNTGIVEDWYFKDVLAATGGSGLAGAQKILGRAAAAAYLNAAMPDDLLYYPLHRDDTDHPETGLRYMVQQAWGDRADMLALAYYLDGLNNLGSDYC